MISSIRFLFKILNKKQKGRFFLLLFSMTFSGFLEIINILCLFEFVSFLSSDNSQSSVGFFVQVFSFLNLDYNLLNLESLSYTLILITGLNVLSNLFTIYLTAKFHLITGGEIESNLFSYYLERDYLFHVETTSSKLMSNIFELVKRISALVLAPLMVILSKITFLIPLLIGLLIYKTEVTFIAITIFVGFYFSFFAFFKKKLTLLGQSQTIITEKK